MVVTVLLNPNLAHPVSTQPTATGITFDLAFSAGPRSSRLSRQVNTARRCSVPIFECKMRSFNQQISIRSNRKDQRATIFAGKYFVVLLSVLFVIPKTWKAVHE